MDILKIIMDYSWQKIIMDNSLQKIIIVNEMCMTNRRFWGV